MTDDAEAVPDREPAPRQAPLWQRVAAGGVGAAIALLGALPARLAYALADLAATAWFLYWACTDRRSRRSKGYWRNRSIAFRVGAPLGPVPPPRHLWRWSRHMAWLVVDFCRMRRIDAASLRAHCDLTEYPQLAALYAEGNGLVFATGHVGVWDVAGYVAGILGLPITSVFRPSPFPALDRLIADLRTGTGQTVVARKNVLWTLRRVLAQKQVVGLLCDGGGKHSSVMAPFLGTPAKTVATPALLHLTTGAPIAVVACLRAARMRYRLRVYDVIRHAPSGDRDADLRAITTRVNAGLSQAIAEAPEQWFWQSRRFRHRPDGEQPGADGLPPLARTGPASRHGDDKS